jgi:hypothetical protein
MLKLRIVALGIFFEPDNDQAHRRQWGAAELPSGGAPC